MSSLPPFGEFDSVLATGTDVEGHRHEAARFCVATVSRDGMVKLWPYGPDCGCGGKVWFRREAIEGLEVIDPPPLTPAAPTAPPPAPAPRPGRDRGI